MMPAHILAAYHPATVYSHPVPQIAGAAIAITFLAGLVFLVLRGIASLSKDK